MALVQSYYARPDDDLAQTAVSVTSDDADPEYPAEYLVSADPAEPAKLLTTSGAWVLDFGSAISPVAAILVYQYLLAGLDVRIQGNDADTWGSPAFSQAFTIPAKRKDGPVYQKWTRNPVVVLSGNPSYRYWRLAVVGTNDQAVQVGRLLLLANWRPVTLFYDGDTITETDDVHPIVNETELEVDIPIRISGPRGTLSAQLVCTDLDAGTEPYQEAEDFRQLWESADGIVKPFPVLGIRENAVIFGRFAQTLSTRTHKVGGAQLWPFEVREVSRGIPWP